MKHILFFVFASLSFAQFNSSAPAGATVVQASPNGQTCVTTTAKARIYNGTIYTCQSGHYAAVSSGGSATPGGASGAVQFNDAGALGGDSNLVWTAPQGGPRKGLFLGGHASDLGDVSFSSFWSQPSAENYWSFTMANNGNGYAENGYFFWNTSDSTLHDLFYNGAKALVDSNGNITDQSYFIESTPDYVAELAVRVHLLTVRRDSNVCWDSTDTPAAAGGAGAPSPDTCIQRSAAGNVKLTDGSSGLANLQAARYQETLHTPTSSSEACIAGQFSDDANFHYVCVSSGVWKRVALSSF